MQRPIDEVLDSPAPAGVRMIASAMLDEWLGMLPRLRAESDDEALHDYRVAMRKLRSWLRAFDVDGNKVRRQLSDLNEATGAARDAEVLVAWLKDELSPTASFVREHLQGGVEVDLAWVESHTQRVTDRLAEKLGRYSLEVPLGGGGAVVPFSWAYASVLRRLHNELTEAALKVGSLDDPERLHKVRIKAKRLRYALLPLKEKWPEAAEAVKLLKERQDLLGELHDRHAFVVRLDTLVAERPPVEIAPGLEALLVKARDEGRALFQQYSQHRHASDVRLAELIDVLSERLGKRMGLQVEVVPQG